MPTIDLIVFAVQAGIRLIQTGRKVYVESTIGGEVEVPFPSAFQETPRNLARNYARGLQEGDEAAKRRFKDLFESAHKDSFSEVPKTAADGEWRLVQQYLSDMAVGLVPSFAPASAHLTSIAVLKQWERGKSPFPSAVQRIGGSLVEIAIDYFVSVPGGLNENSKRGKALKAFLAGLDNKSFQDARWDSVVISLFTTALDTLNEHPEMISDDEEDLSLIRKIVGGVAADAGARLEDLDVGDLDAEARIKRYGQVVLRSLLKNGATAVIEDPSILALERGNKALVQSVGSVFLDVLLGDDSRPLSQGLRQIASTDGLDKLVRAAMKAVVEHPDFFDTGNQSVDAWLQRILGDLYDRGGAGDTLFDPELFAEVAYSAIEHGLDDLPLLLKSGSGTSAVLVDVARLAFDVLTDPPESGKPPRWKGLQLSRSDLKLLFDGVFASLASHTRWLSKRPQVQKAASLVVPLMIEVLSDLGEGNLKPLLRSQGLRSLLAAVLASEIIKPANPPAAQKIVQGLTELLDAVWEDGAAGAERLLDEDVLLDLLGALAASGAADKLFGGKQAAITAVVERILPILRELRKGVVLAVSEISDRLKAA